MRVLVTSTPGAGHVNPMVPVVSALRAAGHDVTWATGADACARVEAAGFEAVACGLALAERNVLLADRTAAILTLPPSDRQRAMFPAIFAEVAAAPMFRDLERIVEQVRPDVLVHEPNELAAAPLAARHGWPHVTVGFGRFHPPGLLSGAIEHLAPLWATADRPVPADLGLYDHLYVHPLPASLQPVPDGVPVVAARPEGFDGGDGPPPRWLGDLGVRRPLVYVTFGTEFGSAAPLGDVLEAAAGLDVDVLATVGNGPDPSTIAPLPGNVRVERFVPQRHVLGRASALVSHAGSGAMIGAAIAGVPQVALPIGADQFGNAELIAGAGIGVALLPGERTVGAIAAAIERVLTDPAFAEACRRLADEIASMPGADHVEPLVAALAPTTA